MRYQRGQAGSAAPDATTATEPGAPAAPAGSAAAVSGEVTVWAMGNEGTKLGVMADKFMAANPDVKVSVTPVDWGQAVAKLQTAIGGGETPDVSQMGTDMMGQFVETGALEPVPADIDPARFFESAWQTNVVDGQAYGVPWYVETRVLYYRTDIAEKAGITAAPDDLGRAQGDGQGDAGRGRRRVRHRARDQERPGVSAVRLVERR